MQQLTRISEISNKVWLVMTRGVWTPIHCAWSIRTLPTFIGAVISRLLPRLFLGSVRLRLSSGVHFFLGTLHSTFLFNKFGDLSRPSFVQISRLPSETTSSQRSYDKLWCASGVVTLGKIKISNEDQKKENVLMLQIFRTGQVYPKIIHVADGSILSGWKFIMIGEHSGCLKTSFDMQILLRNLRGPTLHSNVTRMHTHAVVDERKQVRETGEIVRLR